jgi:hypothetical protein
VVGSRFTLQVSPRRGKWGLVLNEVTPLEFAPLRVAFAIGGGPGSLFGEYSTAFGERQLHQRAPLH